MNTTRAADLSSQLFAVQCNNNTFFPVSSAFGLPGRLVLKERKAYHPRCIYMLDMYTVCETRVSHITLRYSVQEVQVHATNAWYIE